ncbi:MAG: cupin domain-containing protein [Saprospiraceae bacterium]|nr:cupin domain-containing protein [Saprospiraceae bacterium]
MIYDFRPVAQQVVNITHSSPEIIVGEMWLGKGQDGPPLHIHPALQEELEVISGKVEIYRFGKWEIITKGAKWTVPPGEVHTFRAVPDSEANLKVTGTPALGFEGYFKDTDQLIKSGKLTSFNNWNGIIYSAMLLDKYSDTMQPAQKSLKFVVRIAIFIGKIIGKKV